MVLDEAPVGLLAGSRTDDLRLGNIVAQDALRAFQFQGHILYDDDFEFFHLANVIVK